MQLGKIYVTSSLYKSNKFKEVLRRIDFQEHHTQYDYNRCSYLVFGYSPFFDNNDNKQGEEYPTYTLLVTDSLISNNGETEIEDVEVKKV